MVLPNPQLQESGDWPGFGAISSTRCGERVLPKRLLGRTLFLAPFPQRGPICWHWMETEVTHSLGTAALRTQSQKAERALPCTVVSVVLQYPQSGIFPGLEACPVPRTNPFARPCLRSAVVKPGPLHAHAETQSSSRAEMVSAASLEGPVQACGVLSCEFD